MRILIVAATDLEIAPLAARLQGSRASSAAIECLTTGVGMVATAAQTSRALARTHYDLALNFGVCGSFDRALPPGTVVHVVSDRIAELGAEDGDAFLTVRELDLPAECDLVNPAPPSNPAIAALPAVRGITVNTVHGNARSIAGVVQRFHPQVESMEGAAFMYACLLNDVPFAQVRAVSNVVEQRNRGAWKLADAIASLCDTAMRIVDQA
jgi:futalosine hydrolase